MHLLRTIEIFLARTGMPPTRFGRNAVSDPRLVLGILLVLGATVLGALPAAAGDYVNHTKDGANGGGGGQPFYAQAGGSKLEGLNSAIEKAKALF